MRSFFTKIIAHILTIILVLSAILIPKYTNAQLKSIINVTSCASGAIASQWLTNKTEEGARELAKSLPASIQQLLGFGSKLQQIISVPVSDKITEDTIQSFNRSWVNKETRLDVIARCTAREVLDKLTGNILNIVRNHGRDGGPTFVKNWRNFTTGSQYRGENVFRAMLSNTNICNYFGKELKQLFNANNPTQLTGQNTRLNDLDSFALKAGCTLPNNWSLEEYQRDFAANGGWEAFAKLLEPQNNTAGSFLLAMDEAAKQREFEQTLDLTESGGGGGGFTSRRGRGSSDSCLIRSSNNQCVVYKDILTPGSILENSVNTTIEQEFAFVTNADELNEIISGLISRILNGVLNRALNLGDNNDNRPVDNSDLPDYTPLIPNSGSSPTLPGNLEIIDNSQPTSGGGGQNPITGGGGNGLISGYVFEDLNKDGILDSGEPLLSNMIVYLQSPSGSTNLGTNQTFQGIYTFGGLNVGEDYRVTHYVPAGYVRTNDDSTIINVTTNSVKDFGITRL